jgi:hypothetical protein
VQRLADVRILEARGRQFLRHALAVIGELGLLAVLEQEGEDVVHAFSFFL